MTNKYKEGDIVHVRLTATQAKGLSDIVWQKAMIYTPDIIAHHPTPEPVVRWINVYDGETFEHESIEAAKRNKATHGLEYLFTARLERPDGDTTKKPIVTVEDV